MKHTVNAKWIRDQAFASSISGHEIIVEKESPEAEGIGSSPKKLMLLALGGCTGIDVVTTLKKMRVELKDLNITVEGELTEEIPRYYKMMHVIYEFTGKDLSPEILKKAVELSEEKYCGVRALYVKAIKVTSEIRIIEI
jgi:putative redox protein